MICRSVIKTVLLCTFSALAHAQVIGVHGGIGFLSPVNNGAVQATATASSSAACVGGTASGKTFPGVGAAYWEIGTLPSVSNPTGVLVSGNLYGSNAKGQTNVTYQPNQVVQWDSFSKVPAAAAIVQMRGGVANLTTNDILALHMLDGHMYLGENSNHTSCPNSISIDTCFNTQFNKTLSPSFAFTSGSALLTATNSGTHVYVANQPVTLNGAPSPFSNSSTYYVSPTNLTSTTMELCKPACPSGGGEVVASATTQGQLQASPSVTATFTNGSSTLTNTGTNYFVAGQPAAINYSSPSTAPPAPFQSYGKTSPYFIYYVGPAPTATTFTLCATANCSSGAITVTGTTGTATVNVGHVYNEVDNTNNGGYYYQGAHDEWEFDTQLGTLCNNGTPASPSYIACNTMTPTSLATVMANTLTTAYQYPQSSCGGSCTPTYSEALPSGGGDGSAISVRIILQNILAGCTSGTCSNGGLYYLGALSSATSQYDVCSNPGGNYTGQTYNGGAGPSSCPALSAPIPENWRYGLGIWHETSLLPDAAQAGDGAWSGVGSSGYYAWIDRTLTYYGIFAVNSGAGTGFNTAECGRLVRTAFFTGSYQAGPWPTVY